MTSLRPNAVWAGNRLLRANLLRRLHAIDGSDDQRGDLRRTLKERLPLQGWALSVDSGDGEERWFELVGEAVWQDGRFAGYRGIARDVSGQIARNRMIKDVLDSLPDAVGAFDHDDSLVLFNAPYRSLYGDMPIRIGLGTRFSEIIRSGLDAGCYPDAGDTAAARQKWYEERVAAHQTANQTVIERLSDGRWVQIRECRSPGGYIVGVRSDITELKLNETRLQLIADRDPLTGIASRAFLFKWMDDAFADPSRREEKHAFVVLDLDHFKSINDTLGHDAGDVLLMEVANRLRSTIRRQDIAARLGGDEFAIVISQAESQDDVERMVARLAQGLAEPITISGQLVQPHASIGIAMGSAMDSSPEELCKRADIALLQAKEQGRDRWNFYTGNLAEDQRRSLSLAHDLREGLLTDQLVLVFQPQIHLASGRMSGVEALVRWQRDGQLRSPAEFLNVARRHGLITEVGRVVIRKALSGLRLWLDQGLDPGNVSINIEADQLKCQTFHDELVGLLKLYDIPPRRLECEITEDVAVDRGSSQVVGAIGRLKSIGVSIALDDFGTGYASLTHLKRLHAQTIKIDRSFVVDLPDDKEAEVITRALVTMSKSLGLKVVAEGIETQAQLDCLQAMGCDIGQGYLFARPMLADQLAELMRTGYAARDAAVSFTMASA